MRIFKIKILSDLDLWNHKSHQAENVKGCAFFSLQTPAGMMILQETLQGHVTSQYYLSLDDKYEIIQEFDLEEILNQTSNTKNDDNASVTERAAPLMSTSTLQGLLGNNLSKLTVEYK